MSCPTPSSLRTATSCTRPLMSTPNCSGPCAAVEATSGSSSSSSSGCIPLARGPWSWSSPSRSIADVDDDATAFSHRSTRFEYVAAVKWSDPGEDGLQMGAARQAAAKLDPFAVGAYVNTLSDEGASGVRRAYSEAKRARLTAVKDAYDPDNVFHLNHNIAPTGHGDR